MITDASPFFYVMGGLLVVFLACIVLFVMFNHGTDVWMREHKGKGDGYIKKEDE